MYFIYYWYLYFIFFSDLLPKKEKKITFAGTRNIITVQKSNYLHKYMNKLLFRLNWLIPLLCHLYTGSVWIFRSITNERKENYTRWYSKHDKCSKIKLPTVNTPMNKLLFHLSWLIPLLVIYIQGVFERWGFRTLPCGRFYFHLAAFHMSSKNVVRVIHTNAPYHLNLKTACVIFKIFSRICNIYLKIGTTVRNYSRTDIFKESAT